MKQTLFLTILLLLISPAIMLAQQIGDYTSVNGFRLSYMGSVTYPGFKIGYEHTIRKVEVSESLLNEKTYKKERYLSYNLGMYRHPTFHDNYFAQVEWNLRRQRNKGLYYEFAPGAGISRTFLNGATYKVNHPGEVSKVPMAGNFFALLSVSGSMGYNFSLKGNLPGSIFVKPGLLFLLPYNKLVYTRPTFEVGFAINLRNTFDKQTDAAK